jgi:hypothetical protein
MTSKDTEPERNTKTEEIKSYLTHEISVLGKTVPTLAIAAVVMVGGASAAVLSSFGTVSGTADVTQAIDLTSEDDFTFATDSSNDVGETTVTTRTVNNNADVSASYAFETSGAVTGVDSHTFRKKTYQEAQSSDDASVERHYDESSDEWVINVSDLSSDSGAIYFDSDFNGVPNFQLGFKTSENSDDDLKNEATAWKNVDGTYTEDTAYNRDSDPADSAFGDNPKTSDDRLGSLKDTFSGEIGNDYILVRVDRSELGTSFQYGLKSGFSSTNVGDFTASDDDVSQASFIGPVVQSGASHDLSDGGNISTSYDAEEGVVEFVVNRKYDDMEHSGAVYFDSDSDGTVDFQVDFLNTKEVTAREYDSGWKEAIGYNRNEDPVTPEFGSNPVTSGDRPGDLPDVFSGKVNDTHAVIEVQESQLGESFRYGAKLNTAEGGLSTYASGDGEFDQVDTSGFAVVSRGDETLSSGASQDYTFVHDFAINLDPSETYSLTTDVVPVTE